MGKVSKDLRLAHVSAPFDQLIEAAPYCSATAKEGRGFEQSSFDNIERVSRRAMTHLS